MKVSNWSKACNTNLRTTRMTAGGPHSTPKCHFYTQSLREWLTFFLSRPGIKDVIDQSYQHMPNPHMMCCLWDSPAWQDLPDKFSTIPGNLMFNIYINWFNPFTNKIAGKTVSASIILTTCLNISYKLQESLEATCHLGITPLPKEPSVSTINHLTSPIVMELEELWEGVTISTFQHPEGVQKHVGILFATTDLLGIWKLLRYAAVNTQKFCSFCDLNHDKLGDINQGIGQLRTGEDVWRAGRAFLDASTIEMQKKLFKVSGVCFSMVQQLSYQDPVCHTVLGMMHNWLEGVLQHQVHNKWQIGGVTSKGPRMQKNWTSKSVEETELTTEDAYYKENDSEAKAHDSSTESGISSSIMDSGSVDHMDIDSDNQEWYEMLRNLLIFHWYLHCRPTTSPETFNKELMSCIWSGLAAVIIPSWLEQPPTNLGEKSHGKLKADMWRILFTVFLPLILPELWHNASMPEDQLDHSKLLLENFHSLVYCTNIVCCNIVMSHMPELYTQHYCTYLLTSGKQVLAFSFFFFLWMIPKEEKGRKKDSFGSFGQKVSKGGKRHEGTLIPFFIDLFWL